MVDFRASSFWISFDSIAFDSSGSASTRLKLLRLTQTIQPRCPCAFPRTKALGSWQISKKISNIYIYQNYSKYFKIIQNLNKYKFTFFDVTKKISHIPTWLYWFAMIHHDSPSFTSAFLPLRRPILSLLPLAAPAWWPCSSEFSVCTSGFALAFALAANDLDVIRDPLNLLLTELWTPSVSTTWAGERCESLSQTNIESHRIGDPASLWITEMANFKSCKS